MTLKIDPIKDKAPEIIEAIMASEDMPEKMDLNLQIRLCVEEVVTNICNYAYEDGAGGVMVTTKIVDGMLHIIFQDSGVPFNPLVKEDPDTTLSAEDRDIGGLGIFLCKQLMTEIHYEHKDTYNILTLCQSLKDA